MRKLLSFETKCTKYIKNKHLLQYNNIIFLDAEVEFEKDTSYVRNILDVPDVEISETDETNCNEEETDEPEIIQLANTEEDSKMNVKKSLETEETWDANKVKKLLNMYLINIEKFKNPKVRKKLLWKKIGAMLGKDADNCDKKFRNLKQHYITLIRKKNQFGRNNIRWPFFDLFEQISLKGGFNLADAIRFRPIAKKPEWGSPQYIVVNDASTIRNPILVNTATPINSGVKTFSICDLPDSGPPRKRKLEEFQSISDELRNRQKNIEAKLDRLVEVVEESNNIQRERNKLFQEYLRKNK